MIYLMKEVRQTNEAYRSQSAKGLITCLATQHMMNVRYQTAEPLLMWHSISVHDLCTGRCKMGGGGADLPCGYLSQSEVLLM